MGEENRKERECVLCSLFGGLYEQKGNPKFKATCFSNLHSRIVHTAVIPIVSFDIFLLSYSTHIQ